MGERLRCAVIGTGSAGLEILNRLAHSPKATAVAIAENNAQRAREVCDRYRIPRSYSDYRELIDQPDIDAVAIATPTHLHAEMAIASLKARKHVLVERPLALNAREIAKVAETAAKMKHICLLAQEMRFQRQAQLARAIIQRGELGEVYRIRAAWRRRHHLPRIGSWHTQKKLAGGGCANDLGLAMLDLCFYLLGDFQAVTVVAQTQAKFGPRGLGEQEPGRPDATASRPVFDVEDSAAAFIRMQSGRSITLDVAWAGHLAAETPEQELELLGTNGGLALFPARLFRPGPNGYDCTLLNTPKSVMPEDCVQHFVQCILENKKPLVSLEEALAVQKVVDALHVAAATGKEAAVRGEK
jgi:predicted dehydrogenase